MNPKIKILIESLIKETFADKFPKDTIVDITDIRKEFKKEILTMINNSYGENNIKSPDVIINEPSNNFWIASDIDEDPESDLCIFGKKHHMELN